MHLRNLLSGCWHRRITFPRSIPGRSGETYVVCLECGKEMPYDWQRMRVLKGTASRNRAGKSR